ncbi:ribosylnicotinamide kinase [Exophiala dermatitidis]|nr:ribosylnicotinamide kinase [Exophiala dermatitidis]KAJ4596491.1 ribosylnicotinamide kinase [Exophiala dermatitidis]KAJ4641046.1 ribosylnicotinamide kinase [Exophiala dermatitidis]KAJ4655088.1 ribosylnicotinamide kinase [Exophiala dermatitidis]KAJ4679033.1 ribosylnicotinamide kinase [Exophiala dermatitidis]
MTTVPQSIVAATEDENKDQPRNPQNQDKDTDTSPSRSRSNAALQTILIGLSGPSSSGKTTLARLLRTIFDFEITVPHQQQQPSLTSGADGGQMQEEGRSCRWKVTLFVLHEDDFYKTDKDVPVATVSSPEYGTRDLLDWDCVESLDLPLLENTLRHVRNHGTLPPDTLSKEDQNAIGPIDIRDEEVERIKREVKGWFERTIRSITASASLECAGKVDTFQSDPYEKEIRICVLDGFLLYSEPPGSEVESTGSGSASASSVSLLAHLHTISRTLLDRRLFLPVTRDQMLQRRLARMGYVTLEGFWVDPPGYVKDVVWPNYARDHSWMFVNGDADACVFADNKCKEHQIDVCPGQGRWRLREVLDWAVEKVEETVVEKLR